MSGLLRLLARPPVVFIAQTLVALVFLAAALGKIGDAATFARQIHYFRLLPPALENLLAMTLPWIELVAALAILFRVRPRAGSAVIAALMGLFVFVVAAALARGLDIECGCFGTADASRVGTAKILENIGLLALSLIACLRPVSPQTAPEAPPIGAPDRASA
jgi:uncharacterized membrane protein YphA (DoxX/SURF4 family)